MFEIKILVFEPNYLIPKPNAYSGLVLLQNQVKEISKTSEVSVITGFSNSSLSENVNYDIYAVHGKLSLINSRLSPTKTVIPHFTDFFSPDIIIKSCGIIKDQIKPDVIYTCGTSFSSVLSYYIQKKTQIPVVHNIYHHVGNWNWWEEPQNSMGEYKIPLKDVMIELIKNFIREIPRRGHFIKNSLNKLDKLVFSSHFVKNKMFNDGLLTNKSRFSEIIYPSIYIPRHLKKRKNDKKIITYFGHLWQGRGVLDLIKAFNLVREHHSEAKLQIAYNNIHKVTYYHFKKLINDYDMHENLILTGVVKDIYKDVVSPSSIIALPYRDSPSIKLIESMGYGKTVITTNLDWANEIIKNNFNGFIVKPNDVNELADKITSILDNISVTNKIGKNARKTVIEKCDIKKNTRKLFHLLEEASNGRMVY